MRIGIDARYLSHGIVGGVRSYVASLLTALMEVAPEHTFIFYADTKRPFELTDLPSHVKLRILEWSNPAHSVYHDTMLGRIMANDRLDIAHFPANYGFGPDGARTVITLHDEINLMPWLKIIRGHPKRIKTMAMMTYLHACSVIAVRRAAFVVTPSEYARREILRYGKLSPARIAATPSAPAQDVHRIEDTAKLAEVRARHHLPERFVLADAFKNPDVLVRAWQTLPEDLRANYRMVFFARAPRMTDRVRQAVDAGDAKFLVRPSHQDLIALYSIADAFVFPSWIEGFGLPVLEAMKCGAPVIASNRGSIPEVAGDAALIIDAEDTNGLAEHVTRVLTDSTLANNLRQRGFMRAAEFSWHKTAQLVLQVYERALELK
jgi:glycosyltransferase involved in cell wall biosynthesis